MNPASPHDYGPLGGLVGAVGSLVAAATAIVLGFRGRAKWEPAEEDLPKGPQKVASLLNAVGIAIIWSQFTNILDMHLLRHLAIGLAIACLFFLCAYALLISMQTYQIVVSTSPNKTASRNIVGGFKLSTEAESLRTKENVTVQEILKGAAYDTDKVWTRPSRALAKLCFVLGYVGLTVCGTLALACSAIIVQLTAQE